MLDGSTINGWSIFYADDNYIYLIADNTVSDMSWFGMGDDISEDNGSWWNYWSNLSDNEKTLYELNEYADTNGNFWFCDEVYNTVPLELLVKASEKLGYGNITFSENNGRYTFESCPSIINSLLHSYTGIYNILLNCLGASSDNAIGAIKTMEYIDSDGNGWYFKDIGDIELPRGEDAPINVVTLPVIRLRTDVILTLNESNNEYEISIAK